MQDTSRRYFCSTHQDKAEPYVRALDDAGWSMRHRLMGARFLLLDADTGSYSQRIERAWHHSRQPSFIYPHAGPPSLLGDFPTHIASRHARCRFVAARGHEAVMRAYGYEGRVEVIGWAWCALREFRPKALRRILFMPIHPNSNGFLSERDRKLNQAAFKQLAEASLDLGAKLKVRHVNELAYNGLEPVGWVEYERGLPSVKEAVRAIDAADLVVAHHTPAYLAVARGVPTLMIAEGLTPLIGGKEDGLSYAAHWGDYRDVMAYPLDILATDDPAKLMLDAARDDEPIRGWRERMIGNQFDGPHFVGRLQSYL